MYSLDDTIAAIATPLGQGSIGIVRLSGPNALPIARSLFAPAGAKHTIRAGRLHYGHIVDPAASRYVDEVLLSYMRAPHTYTRQDVVEINTHGGVVPLREVLALCLGAGARAAQPGEFTLRAFLNGRIDLAQAEAVLDVIIARTEASLRVAVDQLGGRLSQKVRGIRASLVELLAYVEATIDFPDEDIPSRDIGPDLSQTEADLIQLLDDACRGIIYRQGIRVAIVGRPNVGKSSLLNRLLRTDRAIVTSIAGTTRDTVEEVLDLQGIPLVLVDTAGIVESADPIERLGVDRSLRSLESADLVLVMVDGSQPHTSADDEVARLAQGRPAVLVVNKCDIGCHAHHTTLLPEAPHVVISAQTGEGIPLLEETILATALSGRLCTSEELLASNPRHRALFSRALAQVRDALHAHTQGLSPDVVAIDLTEAIHALGEVTGESASDELLDAIFANFCVGK